MIKNLNLSDEMKNRILNQAEKHGLFENRPNLNPIEEDIYEILHLMQGKSKFEHILRELGGWPIDGSWYIPNLHLIGIDETEHWHLDNIREKTGYQHPMSIIGLWLADDNMRVHICSFVGSCELFRVGSSPLIYPEGGLDYLENMTADQRDALHKFEDEVTDVWNMNTKLIDYYNIDVQDKSLKHIGAPEKEICDETQTKEDRFPDSYYNYMKEMAGEALREEMYNLNTFKSVEKEKKNES